MKKTSTSIILFFISLSIFSQNQRFISHEEALEDIDSLFYTISEIHPDMFGICNVESLMGKIDSIKHNITDSIEVAKLYRELAPAVAMLGDGHTDIYCPIDEFYTSKLPRLPLAIDVNVQDMKLTVTGSVDNCIPRGAEIVSINGITSESMLKEMAKYVSGERNSFKLSKIRIANFEPFFHLLYISDKYDIEFRQHGSKDIAKKTVHPASRELLRNSNYCNNDTKGSKGSDYSYQILWDKNAAVLNFKACNDSEKMKTFADSMITDLNSQSMKNLIIDIRDNPGGEAAVCDELLRHFAPKPFRQFDKIFFRLTPTAIRFRPDLNFSPGLNWIVMNDADLIQPTVGNTHFNGKVYILTSNFTYSAAASLAWTCKQNNFATIIGEETGGMNVSMGAGINYTLPHSKLVCAISLMKFWECGASEKDVRGTTPDYHVKQESALEKAFRLTRK